VKIEGDAGGIPGTQGLAPNSVLRCRWWRYAAAGDARLIIEQWGTDFRVLRGGALREGSIELMPGS
jgi:hypothetical protein